jgi:hypothetical protein
MYGALIVRGDNELELDDERVLVFDDLRVDKSPAHVDAVC